MTLIALQQDFLPTDTVSALTQEPNNPVALTVGLILGMLGFLIYLVGVSKNSALSILGMFAVAGGVFLFITGQGTPANEFTESVEAATEKDFSSFVSNIESIYDVEVALPDDESYGVNPEKKRSIIAIQDGVGYEALVSQDSDSYEPTLIMIATEASDITEFRKK